MKLMKIVDFEFAEELTVDEVAVLLDMYRESAKGLLSGEIAFKQDELERLAIYRGVSVDKLLK